MKVGEENIPDHFALFPPVGLPIPVFLAKTRICLLHLSLYFLCRFYLSVTYTFRRWHVAEKTGPWTQQPRIRDLSSSSATVSRWGPEFFPTFTSRMLRVVLIPCYLFSLIWENTVQAEANSRTPDGSVPQSHFSCSLCLPSSYTSCTQHQPAGLSISAFLFKKNFCNFEYDSLILDYYLLSFWHHLSR